MGYKTMILPFIAVLAMAVQLIFGIEINKDIQEQVAMVIGNGIAVGVVIYGIVKNHKKKDVKKNGNETI